LHTPTAALNNSIPSTESRFLINSEVLTNGGSAIIKLVTQNKEESACFDIEDNSDLKDQTKSIHFFSSSYSFNQIPSSSNVIFSFPLVHTFKCNTEKIFIMISVFRL